MRKILKFSTLLALISVPLSSQAWWGPYGGNPYWGGYAPMYAPPYAAAPYYPAYGAYGVPAYPMYRTPYNTPYGAPYNTPYRPEYRAPWTNYAPQYPVQGPWGNDPMGAADNAFPDMQAATKRSEAEHKRAMELSAARHATFQKRVNEQRAAMKARREQAQAAWRQRMNPYAAPESMATDPQQPMPVQPQAAPTKPQQTPEASTKTTQ